MSVYQSVLSFNYYSITYLKGLTLGILNLVSKLHLPSNQWNEELTFSHVEHIVLKVYGKPRGDVMEMRANSFDRLSSLNILHMP